MEAGLLQRQVAERIGIGVNTLITWEQDEAAPEVRYWPRIIAFLGYDPNPAPMTLGLPRKRAAARLGIDEGTLRRYEEGVWSPTTRRAKRIIERFLVAK